MGSMSVSSFRTEPAGKLGGGDDKVRSSPSDVLLEVRNLGVTVPRRSGDVYAVRDVSLRIGRGERVAILGESGSGKTMTALALIGLQPRHAKLRGMMNFEGAQVDFVRGEDHGSLVRRNAGIIFQDSMSALNPILRVGTQLMETLFLRGWKRKDAFDECVRVLEHVGVPDAVSRMRAYPHELSGGMRQRVMISMTLLAKPSLLIADEPTTALDTTVQAQVIDLILGIQAETNMGLMLITHDLAMAAEVCDRAIIMYAGYVVEDLPMTCLLSGKRHPYTRALLSAMPRLDASRDVQLEAIEGEPPPATLHFDQCPFASRCPGIDACCLEAVPASEIASPDHQVRCVHHERHAAGIWRPTSARSSDIEVVQ